MCDVDVWLCNQHVNIDAHGVYNTEKLIEASKRYGVRIRTLTPEQGNPKPYNIASSDPSIIRLTYGYYCQVIGLAERLGAGRISINAGWFSYDIARENAWDQMVAALRVICDVAYAKGIELCLETLVKTPYRLVCCLDDLERALSSVNRPNFLATIDTGTVTRNGESIDTYLSHLGTRIGYVHLTNLNPSALFHFAWGDPAGTLDPQGVLSSLQTGGYSGDCALEMTAPQYFKCPQEILSRAKVTLKGCGY